MYVPHARNCLLLALLTGIGRYGWAEDFVNESARDIPIARDVDVVVVGGSTGAVAAAVAAAENGARVFLAAPHPYLGEDMTATLRLWLEEGEKPTSALARQVFADELAESSDPNRLDFTYEADAPSAGIHADTSPPSRLTDGKWASPVDQSVQYERSANIVADLGSPQAVRKIRVIVFRRRNSADAGSGFDVARVAVSASDDKSNWQQVGVVDNDAPMEDIAALSLSVDATARYFRFGVEMPESYSRMLLGEIELIGPEKDPVAEKKTTVPPRPLHVKKVLDDALLKAGVDYLYSCYATDVLHDDAGNLCGIVMANRAGRQAVLAKCILDATPDGSVARMAGATLRGSPPKLRTFQRVVIGGEPHTGAAMVSRFAAPPFPGSYARPGSAAADGFPVIEYTLKMELADDTYAELEKVDQQARTWTYDPAQQYTSDVLFEIPAVAIHGRASSQGGAVEQLDVEVFRPHGVDRLWVLSGCADVTREQAAELLRPLQLIDAGTRVGQQLAAQAAAVQRSAAVRLSGSPAATPAAEGDVRERLQGVRPTESYPAVRQDARALPVLGRYDVVVIGGGTGGAPAGIAAARQGARTLVVEYLQGLGGVGTEGAISSYYWGNRVGFTATVLDGAGKWEVEPKKEWYRQELLKAGAEIWFGTVGCGSFVRGNRVLGAVVATPQGRGVVLAHTVIDATGNSDIAAAAGAECAYTDASEFGMQGTGLPGRRLGGSYNNTDFTIVDETDMVDIWRTFVFSKEKYTDAFDHGRLIDTRERRRIVGDFTVTILDEVNGRTYPDSVVRAWSNFDTHGYTIDPYFLLEHPEEDGIGVYVPFRAFLPKGVEGLIVTGLSVSAHRDALPLIRMQADIQNGGYAVGLAAAMASYADIAVRNVDVRRLQEDLVKIGNLPESVLEDRDSYPFSDAAIAEAVEGLKNGRGAAVVLADPARALPLIKQAYGAAAGPDRLAYAKRLAALGDEEGAEVLIAELRQAKEWDKGWNFKGMGQFGAALSPLDILIIDLGRAGSRAAVPAILEKVVLLDARQDFSHHRAVGLALELLRDSAAAKPLADLLAKPDMSGHVHKDIATAKELGAAGGTNAERTRRESLRELMLARALYRCGDYQGVGEKILREYTHDLRGHLARHAQAILAEEKR